MPTYSLTIDGKAATNSECRPQAANEASGWSLRDVVSHLSANRWAVCAGGEPLVLHRHDDLQDRSTGSSVRSYVSLGR